MKTNKKVLGVCNDFFGSYYKIYNLDPEGLSCVNKLIGHVYLFLGVITYIQNDINRDNDI